jgi:hypothetical protein
MPLAEGRFSPTQLEEPDRQPQAQHPPWGARKIRELRLRRLPGDVRLPRGALCD